MTNVLHAAAIAVFALGTGAAAVSVLTDDPPAFVLPEGPWEAGRALDGRVFETQDTVRETGEILHDRLHFEDGRFQSEMCQEYCDFGWTEYRTMTRADAVHFTVTTRCPDAPHTVIWYGTVTGDEIRFEGRWTTRRWYWTRHLNVAGEGAAG